MSRFLAKVALEILAARFLSVLDGLDDVIDKCELDELRNYARLGSFPKLWPFYTRVIYPERKLFVDGAQRYEILHEFNLLYTESHELYSVVVIFGIEYVINMGEPSLEGYIDWLKKNNYKSPLHLNDSQIPSILRLFLHSKPPL